jgi:hypothetical protein
VRKLKRGSEKHKGKFLPFICFNCGRAGNFVVTFPYEKREIVMMRIIILNKNITIE